MHGFDLLKHLNDKDLMRAKSRKLDVEATGGSGDLRINILRAQWI